MELRGSFENESVKRARVGVGGGAGVSGGLPEKKKMAL